MTVKIHQIDDYEVHITYHDNGLVEGEVWMRNGVPDGRIRYWDEEGVFLAEQFFLRGKRISKKKYMTAANENVDVRAFETAEVPWSDLIPKPTTCSKDLLAGIDLSNAIEARD